MSYYEKIPVIIEAWEMTKNNILNVRRLLDCQGAVHVIYVRSLSYLLYPGAAKQ